LAAQTVAHLPQLLGSDCTSVQVPLQSKRPAAQTQLPLLQVWPTAQSGVQVLTGLLPPFAGAPAVELAPAAATLPALAFVPAALAAVPAVAVAPALPVGDSWLLLGGPAQAATPARTERDT